MTTRTNSSTASSSRAIFPLVEGRARGYAQDEVGDFLRRAKASFEKRDGQVTAADIREVSFALVKGGYEPAAVDAALARIEDALAQRERSAAIARQGAGQWVQGARETAQVILDHLGRPPRERFARVGMFSYGYDRDEVDHAGDRIVRFLRDGEPLTADQVRSVAFRMRRGGYREEQVDALLDATIDVVLAVG